MPEVTLQSYGEEMRRLVGEGLYDQAIAMGRHVLRVYPKHLQTYRILGEACLEKGNYKEAHALFARALACDPEDLFARVGIAVAHEKQGNLDLAIWHLERAYELAPGNAELRKELQRLHAQREGVARPRLKLTSAAVARLYARSGLWSQAIQEFRTLLEREPNLVDIKVALAEALWHSNERKEAVRVCEEILAEYPHCLKANLILGEIGLRGERESEGRALLQLAQDIDPDNSVAQKLFGNRSPLPARVVKILPLEEMPAPAAEPEVLITEEEIPPEALPGWLAEAPVKPLHEVEPETVAPEETVAGLETEEAEAGIPDWLQRIRERQKAEEERPAAPVGEEITEDTPDWLVRLRQEEVVSEPPATEEAAEALPLAEDQAQARVSEEEGIPDWLRELAAQEETEEVAAPPEAPAELLPDWLMGLGAPAEPFAEVPPEIPESTEVEAEALLAETLGGVLEEAPTVEAAPAEAVEAVPAEAVAEEAVPAEAVAEAPVEEAVEAVPAEAVEAAPAEAVEAAPAEAVEAAPAEAVAEEAVEAVPAAVLSPEQILARARELRDGGDADAALDLYEQLIRSGVLLDRVAADLETGATGPLARSRTYTLIGDLCMKQDRLQKALEAYRRALELVKEES